MERSATGTRDHPDDPLVMDVLESHLGECDDPRRAPEAVSAARRLAAHAAGGLRRAQHSAKLIIRRAGLRRPGATGGKGGDLASTHMSAATGHADRQARTVAVLVACALITVITVGELAGGSSPATGPSSAVPARSPVSAAGAAAAARVFTSPRNGYTVALPAGWSAEAGRPFDGPGGAGLGKDGVDVFHGPPYVVAWAFTTSRPPSLAGYATATARAATQLPCPAAPQIDQHVTIGGAPARLIGMRCPAQGGALMLTAVTTHHHTALVFIFEDSSGMMAAGQDDSVAFRVFLAGIRIGDTQKRMLCAPKSTCPALTSHVRNRCSACP